MARLPLQKVVQTENIKSDFSKVHQTHTGAIKLRKIDKALVARGLAVKKVWTFQKLQKVFPRKNVNSQGIQADFISIFHFFFILS